MDVDASGPLFRVKPVKQIRLQRRVFCCLAAFVVAGLVPAAVAASNTFPAAANSEGEPLSVQSTDTTLTAFMDDLRQVIPDSLVLRWDILSGTVPHGVLFIDGADSVDRGLREALESAITLARNYRLFVESSMSSPRAGVIVSLPFPTLSLNWAVHPYEDVPQSQGLWSQPFADLGDVTTVVENGNTVSLQLSPEAIRRIDAHAIIQGHRRFSIRMSGLEGAGSIGPYTWMPGMRHIPGLPSTVGIPSATGGPQLVSVDVLRQQFATRIAARKRVEAYLVPQPGGTALKNDKIIGQQGGGNIDPGRDPAALGLRAGIVWTAAPVRPHYREPFTLWITQGEDWANTPPFYAAWIETPDQPRRWVALRTGEAGEISIPVPPTWHMAEDTSDSTSLTFSGDQSGADGRVLRDFLRQHAGRDVALLMEGEVIAIMATDSIRPEQLVLLPHTSEQRSLILSRWEATHADEIVTTPSIEMEKPLTVAEAPPPDTSLDESLDFFQVRLMAEPQDRVLIPVTHFAAPGAKQGVVVAVQNEVILTSHTVSGAHLENNGGRLFLHLRLTEEGKNALSDVCFSNLGKQLAIIYEDRLLCAPTIVDWELEELSFKGMDDDWPDVAKALMERLERGDG